MMAPVLASSATGGDHDQDLNKARYAFLVYSASVHHWWVARPLLRPDSRRFAVASFTRVVEALEAANDPNLRWRCQNALTLALCHDECKTTDKALASITMALNHAKQVPPTCCLLPWCSFSPV
jgi:hypothetical protein